MNTTPKTEIKKWYLERFPTDECGQNLRAENTFAELFHAMYGTCDVYSFIFRNGFADSIIRERIFEELADIMGFDYDVIYKQWLRLEDDLPF